MVVTECEGFTVYQFVWWAINSNAYVVCGMDSMLIVDPIDSEEFYVFLQKQPLQKVLVLLTHGHYDHISGLNKLREIFPDCCVISSKACSENIQMPKKNRKLQ
ncbi:MAG: MBL fold metallo-hydrolase [Acidaminococcaceae bacterium]|nr:MBL fold metallo-hydrolase [Acidaminococcaceae bacterium]